MTDNYSCILEDEDAQALRDISAFTGKAIATIPFKGEIDKALRGFDYSNKEACWHEDNHVVGLFFNHSELELLPESIAKLTSLRFLIILDCPSINSFPSSFEQLKNLEVIELSNDPGYGDYVSFEFPDIFSDRSCGHDI